MVNKYRSGVLFVLIISQLFSHFFFTDIIHFIAFSHLLKECILFIFILRVYEMSSILTSMRDSLSRVLSSEAGYALSTSSSRLLPYLSEPDIGGTFLLFLLVADLASVAFSGIGDSSSLPENRCQKITNKHNMTSKKTETKFCTNFNRQPKLTYYVL